MSDFKTFIKGASDFLQSQDTGGYAPSPPMTQTASSHSITIRTDRGLKIGRIQSWSPSMGVTVDQLFEIQQNANGEPIELVQQNQTTNRISVERYELYTKHIGEAFNVPIRGKANTNFIIGSGNTGDLVSLVQQVNSFNIREVWRSPFFDIRMYAYIGVLFTDWGITIAANDDRIIKARATLQFTRRIRVA